MLIKVYLWSASGSKSFGHVAMEFSDNTYISWWPEDSATSIGAVAGQRFSAKYYNSLEDEIKAVDASPEKTIHLVKGLDEEKMKQYFKGLLNGSLKWDLQDKSCASVIYAALCEGSDWFKNRISGSVTPAAVADLADHFAKGNYNKNVKGTCRLV